MAIYVRHGGHVQYSFTITSGQTFNPGQVGEVQNTTGAVSKATAASSKVKGLFVETKPSAGNYDETYGNNMASLVIGPAIVESDQLTSGITFTPNAKIYHDSSGNLTTNSANSQALGMSLETCEANSATDMLAWHFYGVRSGLL